MSTARVGTSRLVRVGDGSTVGVTVAAPPHGGRLGLSRALRVWGAGTGGRHTDTFTRTIAPYNGSWYTGNNWGTTTGTVSWPWYGSAAQTWVNGSEGILQLRDYSARPAPPNDWQWAVNQHAYLVNAVPGGIDVTIQAVLNRALAPSDAPGNLGEFLWLQFADQSPYTGAFIVSLSGESGVSIFADNAPWWTSGTTAIPCALTTPFKVRVVRPMSVVAPIEVYVWPATDAQPATPTLSYTPTGTGYDFRNTSFELYLANDNFSVSSDLTLAVDWLDWVGADITWQVAGLNMSSSIPAGSWLGDWLLPWSAVDYWTPDISPRLFAVTTPGNAGATITDKTGTGSFPSATVTVEMFIRPQQSGWAGVVTLLRNGSAVASDSYTWAPWTPPASPPGHLFHAAWTGTVSVGDVFTVQLSPLASSTDTWFHSFGITVDYT